jgi:hypothetical protein
LETKNTKIQLTKINNENTKYFSEEKMLKKNEIKSDAKLSNKT